MNQDSEYIKISKAEYTILLVISTNASSVMELAKAKQKQRGEPWQQQIIDLLEKDLMKYRRMCEKSST